MALHRLRWSTRSNLSLTLFGRSVLLLAAEVVTNVIIWIVAALCFAGRKDGVIGSALLAWTIGLRHGLDADHISAIDNATRQMVNLGQKPVTVGLFFSLGHSTIVIVVNVALAISLSVYSHFDSIGNIGGLIGVSVSASFLFLIAMFNLYFLVQAVRQRRRRKRAANGAVDVDGKEEAGIEGGGLMVRILAPLMRVMDRPWKMYPVGVLFGFGFDTASSIALLALSIVASKGTGESAVSQGKIVVLPLLFTAGMSLVDSIDSIFMLYAYLGPEGYHSIRREKWKLFKTHGTKEEVERLQPIAQPPTSMEGGRDRGSGDQDVDGIRPVTSVLFEEETADKKDTTGFRQEDALPSLERCEAPVDEREVKVNAKTQTMSDLSIVLMAMSIVVALSISLIEILGVIGENCSSCVEAAEAEDGGGLAGSWWRFWAGANDNSGVIGAGIVGAFLVVTLGWYLGAYLIRKGKARRRAPQQEILSG